VGGVADRRVTCNFRLVRLPLVLNSAWWN
jgi:hypothetical protein